MQIYRIKHYKYFFYLQSGPTIRKKMRHSLGNLELNQNHSKKELRILRNTVNAQYGYVFNSPDLKECFSQFEWYIPDPNLKMEEVILSPKEQGFINEILLKEKAIE